MKGIHLPKFKKKTKVLIATVILPLILLTVGSYLVIEYIKWDNDQKANIDRIAVNENAQSIKFESTYISSITKDGKKDYYFVVPTIISSDINSRDLNLVVGSDLKTKLVNSCFSVGKQEAKKTFNSDDDWVIKDGGKDVGLTPGYYYLLTKLSPKTDNDGKPLCDPDFEIALMNPQDISIKIQNLETKPVSKTYEFIQKITWENIKKTIHP